VGCVATLQVRSGAECHSPYAQPENLLFLVESYREIPLISPNTPYLAKWLEDNVLEGLAVFTLPDYHHRQLRTSNPIELGIQKWLKLRTH
jgi:transposase-like protein